jgi:hypothetical protein
VTLPFEPDDILAEIADSPFGMLNDALADVDEIDSMILITHTKDGRARVSTFTKGLFHSLGMLEYSKLVLAQRSLPYD